MQPDSTSSKSTMKLNVEAKEWKPKTNVADNAYSVNNNVNNNNNRSYSNSDRSSNHRGNHSRNNNINNYNMVPPGAQQPYMYNNPYGMMPMPMAMYNPQIHPYYDPYSHISQMGMGGPLMGQNVHMYAIPPVVYPPHPMVPPAAPMMSMSPIMDQNVGSIEIIDRDDDQFVQQAESVSNPSDIVSVPLEVIISEEVVEKEIEESNNIETAIEELNIKDEIKELNNLNIETKELIIEEAIVVSDTTEVSLKASAVVKYSKEDLLALFQKGNGNKCPLDLMNFFHPLIEREPVSLNPSLPLSPSRGNAISGRGLLSVQNSALSTSKDNRERGSDRYSYRKEVVEEELEEGEVLPSPQVYQSKFGTIAETADDSVIKQANLILNKLSVTKFEKLSDQFLHLIGIGTNQYVY